jgi:hypothetical protein
MDRMSKSRKNKWPALTLALGVLGMTAYATHDDWEAVRDQKAVAHRAEVDRQDAEADLVELTARRAKLETPAGQEEQARKLGYTRPGEAPLD